MRRGRAVNPIAPTNHPHCTTRMQLHLCNKHTQTLKESKDEPKVPKVDTTDAFFCAFDLSEAILSHQSQHNTPAHIQTHKSPL